MRDQFGYLAGTSQNDGISFGSPGTTEERWCGVCGTKCAVTRGHNGPTSWAASMAGHGHPHDIFSCPNYGSEWHDLAIKLIHEMRDTHSKRLRALIEADLDDLVDQNLRGA
jgi:hypothetical protein